ncbi:MAG: zeta toxin family protein [Clostridia bacterium]|nr:zeta toxin family protein [Bacilli bacterium]MBR3324778.1 zeta toxin family protein [Clostridia bacterium]
MEKRVISHEVLKSVLPQMPKMIINMLPDTPENLLKYAERVKQISFSSSIKDEEIKKLMKKYLLSDEEYLKTFFYVMALTFYNKKPVDKPEIAVIVAQTGSGKSHLTAKLLRRNSNFVFIDSDKYKHFRFDAKMIANEYQVLYPFLTGPDAYDHADNLYKYAIENRYNVIKETAPSPNKDLLGFKIDRKYKISVHILAVGNLNSLLSIHERYELQILSGLKTAKLTPIIRHNESYNVLLECVKQLIDNNNYDELFVYTRGKIEDDFNPIKIYPSSKYSNPIDAIESARIDDNNITKQEFNHRNKLIIEKMDNRKALKENYEQVEELKKYI